MLLEAGQTIERFTVEARLGEGGMAAVYRVRHNTLGSHHALKLLKVARPDIKRRLVEEGRVQASLHHPNIVAVTDVLEVEGQPGLLMELVDGPTLEEWLWANRPTLEQAEALFRGILAGVARAHRAGLVHRDLKPGNILLDVTDGMVVPKVTDFGLAKILADDDRGHSQTRSGVTLGTPQFMAPEQIRDAKTVDQRADVFALGCILYNLVCGRPPFQDPDILNLYNAIASGAYAPPETFAPGLPGRISAAIAGALTVDRDRRTPDCEALRAVLWPDDAESRSNARMWQGVQTESRAAEKLVPPGTRMPGSIAAPKAASTIGASPAEPQRIATPVPAEPAPASCTKTLLACATIALGLGFVGAGALAPAAWFARGEVNALTTSRAPPAEPAALPQVAAGDELASADVPAPPAMAGMPGPTANGPDEPPAPKPPDAPAATVRPADRRPSPPPSAPAAPVDPKPADARPGPESSATARVSVTGAVERVVLQSGGRTYAPGALNPGTYTVSVQFAGRPSAQNMGTLTLMDGQSAVIACDAGFAMCRFR